MAKMNMGRVILGGVVAGIVMDILGFLVDGMWLAPRWAAAMKTLGHPGFSTRQMVWFNLLGIAIGIVAVWVYAAIRPRFGAGVKTATCAAVAMWIASALLPNLSMMWAMGLFGRRLTLYTTLGALVEMIVGTIAGAALYQEPQAAPAPAAAAKMGQAAQA